MTLADSDRELVEEELGREATPAEAALFENLWSEHCAYRSSRPLLSAFDSEGDQVVVGPGDDAAVVALPGPDAEGYSDTYITLGIESHNHPSYVDPFDGAATGVGGIVRDTMSMGAYPIALADSLYFGSFDREHSKYLFEGVVEGISHYGNCIGVPTVAGSVDFHADYEGNPLVNVACVGLTDEDRLITAEAKEPGNKLLLVGNATGRDGLGGASFASEDLSEDAETEDRPAVQVGDPYAEKLLVETNEILVEENLVEAARDLGAAGLGGASSELVAKGGLGADIRLDDVHQREPNMNALEVLLAESQERMCYEVTPENVERVREVCDRFDVGCSVIGEVTDGNYVATFVSEAQGTSEGASGDEPGAGGEASRETVVDVDAHFLGEGAPMNDLDWTAPERPERDLPTVDLPAAMDAVLSSPNTASKRWVYRQYDHEVGVRTSVRPGDDAGVVAVREAGVGVAISSGAAPNWTSVAPYEGAKAVALENATNLAAKGASPLAAVDCLNGGNPESPDVYGGFKGIVDGLADMCSDLDVPVVGGNVSLYNDSPTGPIPPTPTLTMVGSTPDYDAPRMAASAEGELLLVGDRVLAEPDASARLGGSEYLRQQGGSDRFPTVPGDASAFVQLLAAVAREDHVQATHDVSDGGLAVALAEMVTEDAGVVAQVPEQGGLSEVGEQVAWLFNEATGRALVQTTDPERVRKAFSGVAPVVRVGEGQSESRLDVSMSWTDLSYDVEEIATLRATIEDELE